MRKAWAIGVLDVVQTFRDKSVLGAFVLLPVLLTWIFGAAFGSVGTGPTTVRVVDLDRSAMSQQVIGLLDAEDSFEVVETTEKQARADIRDGKTEIAVIIPDEFAATLTQGEQAATIEVVRVPASQAGQALAQVLDGIAARLSANMLAAETAARALAAPSYVPSGSPHFNLSAPRPDAALIEAADALWDPAPIAVVAEDASVDVARENQITNGPYIQFSMGFVVMFVLFITLGVAGTILEERDQGTMARLLSAPTYRAQIIGGKTIGIATSGMLEALILVGLGAFVFGVPWGSDPLGVAIMLVSYIAAASGLSVFVAAVVKSRDQLSGLTPLIAVALAMVGGSYFDISFAPPLFQTASRFTPTGWAMIGLRDVVARGMGVESVLLPAAVLLGMGAVFFGLGVWRLRLQ